MTSFACPKPRPRLLEKRAAKAAVEKQDRAERKICRLRSGGRCEVVEVGAQARRCARRASQNHHLKGGIGRRNKGASILALHRIEVCDRCHAEITNHVLVPVYREFCEAAATVCYERAQ